MSKQAVANTAPEMAVRRLLHASGLRYRIHRRPIPELRRTADLVFTRQRVAVFVDGCFWHRCPEHGTMPRNNSAWWTAKLQRNTDRDADTNRNLEEAGWTVLRYWEHEDPQEVADAIVAAIRGG